MEYIRVLSKGVGLGYPIEILLEVGQDGYTRRKLERFADGRVALASARFAEGDTRLDEKPAPSLEEIDADPEFVAQRMTRVEFERAWNDGFLTQPARPGHG
ncbi:DUF6881 domain-containing protein [Dyella sp. 2RAB6]|uniref:DUF6881 domain-containing protein n=1 Tax=Dyella sp. 2RAB6 TaxID=3232992 RepID=UPI003F905A3E